jgi:hypothetical protein
MHVLLGLAPESSRISAHLCVTTTGSCTCCTGWRPSQAGSPHTCASQPQDHARVVQVGARVQQDLRTPVRHNHRIMHVLYRLAPESSRISAHLCVTTTGSCTCCTGWRPSPAGSPFICAAQPRLRCYSACSFQPQHNKLETKAPHFFDSIRSSKAS